MGEKKRLAVNMIAQFIAFVINLSINFFLTPYITAHVGKEVYGFVNLAFQSTGYIDLFTTALNAMVGRFITINIGKKDYEKASMYFSSVIVANLLISVIMILPTSFAIIFLDAILNVPVQYIVDVKLLWAFIFADFFLTLCTNSLGVATYASNRLDLSARRNTGSTFLRAALLVFLFVCFPARVWYVGFTKFVLGFYVVVTNFRFKNKLTPQLQFKKSLVKMKAVKELISLGIWNSIQQMASLLINGCDMLITNFYVDALSMTLMGFAKTIPNYLLSIIGIVSGSFAPKMTLIYGEGDMNKFVKYVNSSIKVCGFICSIPILGFIVFGTDFFSLWLPTLSGGEIKTVQILSFLILAQTIFDVYIFPLYHLGGITAKVKIPVFVSLGIGVLNIIGSILLCKYTSLGVYAIQIVSSVLLTARVFFFAPIYYARIIGQKWWVFYIPLLRGTISSIIVMAVFYLISKHVTITSWISLILCAVSCGAIGYFINYFVVLNKEDRKMASEVILNLLRKKRK